MIPFSQRRGGGMGSALEIGGGLSADGARRAARREKDGRMAARTGAIAHALDGLSRAEAARLAGMGRQALRDAVLRYKAEGLAGLRDRPKGRPPRRLAPEEAEPVAAILRGPDPAEDGGSRLDAGRSLPLARAALRQDLSSFEHDPGAPAAWLPARDRRGPITPNAMPRREAGLQKGGLADRVAEAAARHPGKRIELWFEE